jgi:hypothetical protein
MLDCQLVSHVSQLQIEGADSMIAMEGFRVAEKALEDWKKEGKVKAKL